MNICRDYLHTQFYLSTEKANLFKETPFKLQTKISSFIRTDKWKICDVVKIYHNLKNNKARGNNGLIYEKIMVQKWSVHIRVST